MRRAEMRPTKVEFDATVCGGFPVTVRANVYPPEPDVGIFSPQAEVQDIRSLHLTDATFVARKMKDADWEALAQRAVEEATRQERERD